MSAAPGRPKQARTAAAGEGTSVSLARPPAEARSAGEAEGAPVRQAAPQHAPTAGTSPPGASLLTLNAGSSSIKFALFDIDGATLQLSGQMDGLGEQVAFKARSVDGALDARHVWQAGAGGPVEHQDALAWIIGWLAEHRPGLRVRAVGHRVVHGGAHYRAPVLIDDAVLDDLHALVRLAPLHQPHNLAGIAAARAGFAGVPQVACFDTAFHHGHDFVDDAFALPRSYFDAGVRRYGFHGLSYECIAARLQARYPAQAAGRVVVAHLGNGASMCGLRAGRSVATTMGFSALDGLPMGTRCGRIDPGVLLYMLQEQNLTAADMVQLLYHQSGLKALSGGLSHDMRTLEAAGTSEAEQAIGYYAAAIRRETGALAATLGGLDALVFTGGIGENSVRVRRQVLQGLQWLGVEFDEAANAAQSERLSTDTSRVLCLRLATDEEGTIARHTGRVVAAARAAGGLLD